MTTSTHHGHGPLVVFTSLAIAGAGTLAAWSVLGPALTNGRRALWAGTALLVSGLLVSLAHLGRRERAVLALRGLPRSPISLEGVIGGLTVGLALFAAAGLGGAPAAIGLRAAVALSAMAFLGSVGYVYAIRGQLTWTGISAVTPLTAGLAFGAILLSVWPPTRPVSTLALVVLALDAIVWLRRWRGIVQLGIEWDGALPEGLDRRHEWLAARFLLLDALPCISLLVWPTPLAAVIAAAGLIVDRLAFYELAFPQRPEAEIARIERQLSR